VSRDGVPLVEVLVEAMAFGGDAVGRLPSGKVAFVRGALPGERAMVRLFEERSNLARGVAERVASPSPDRVEPVCAVADRCGGCPWMHLALPQQRSWKRRLLAQELVRAGVVADEAAVAEVVGGASTGFRTRCRLHFTGGELGTRPARGGGVIPLARCPILAPPLEAFALHLAEALRGAGAPVDDTDVELYVDADGERGLWVAAAAPREARRWAAVAGEVGATAVAGEHRGRRWSLGDALRETAAGRSIGFEPGVFVQTNREATASVVDEVLRAAGAAGRLAEVYAGVGTFSVHLAAAGWEGTLSEGDRRATGWLQKNLGRHADRFGVHCERDDDATRRLSGEPAVDLLVADPPRAGMKALVPVFAAAPPARVVVVSCHPMAAVRDLARLVSDFRYGVARVVPIDLFPQTDHLEVVALAERNPPA
jgi:23S rRNA (uracil1939-C5)-methyltransferase